MRALWFDFLEARWLCLALLVVLVAESAAAWFVVAVAVTR